MMVAHKLDPRALEEAIRGKLPPGTLKSGVIEFVRAMRPFRCEDYGKKVTAHWIEETGDLVRSWNILVVFHFDEEDRLLHYSQTATDFIDYDLVAMSLQ
ncbi:MAG: hypothetical protein JWO71_1113 [Candidatus Acidoferrum typicum]|nr:hypothetical protein [Candidatus Acidoferrum typicum]